MDELAAHVKADPVEYRLRHLSFPRLAECVRAAAKTANWEARPSPKGPPERRCFRARHGNALLMKATTAMRQWWPRSKWIRTRGKITVKRLVIANDCGPISNPDGLRNQLEGGALQGMSRALGEEVTWDAEKVTSIDWRTYHSLPVGFAVPKIECVLLNQPDEEATGAGETSITITAAAIGNAVFDATGARLRQTPFTAERVKAALAART